jgi:DNA-binding HxlR family transcriptional regulator
MKPPNRQGTTALREAVSRIGDRWSLLLVETLLAGPLRWRDLLEGTPGIAPNVLADRLRRLERAGVVTSSAYSQRPPRMTYELTADGQGLADVLKLLAAWGGEEHTSPPHSVCGTALEVRWFCPTCEVAVEEPGAEAPEVTVV